MKYILIALLVVECLTVPWPTSSKTVTLSSPITVKAGQTYDGFKEHNNYWVRFERGKSGLGECTNIEAGKADACFLLYKGATLKNVILGAKSINHVYCVEDGCTIHNVYWEDVCVNAITFENGSSTNAKYFIRFGAAKNGNGKFIQNNSAGTVYFSNFYVENVGKLYKACGNCKRGYQGKRDVFLINITAKNVETLAEYNSNFEDNVILKNIKLTRVSHACRAFQGRNDGKEPTALEYSCEPSKNYISSCTCK